jgi:protease I
MKLQGKKIAVLLESDFYEPEIFYYKFRFAEEGADLHFLSRLWGQPRLTFTGHEYKVPMECSESFEGMSDDELKSYSAIIVPSGMVSDRLRYTENVAQTPPAAEFMRRAFQHEHILKGIICHGMWLMAPVIDAIKGRKVVVHNNLHADALNYGLVYVDDDVVVDGDLITARSGGHCNVFARRLIETIAKA